MIIAIDGNEANLKRRVGVNQFAFEVIWSFYQIRRRNQKLRKLKFLVFLRKQPLKDLPPANNWWHYEVFGPVKFWTWTGLVKRLFWGRPRPDILFSPSHYGPGFSPLPFVISVMDLGFLRFRSQFTQKDFLQLKYWTAWSVKRARKIIAISRFTRNDIEKVYGVEREKIAVVYPGYEKRQKTKAQEEKLSIPKLKKKYQIRGDYILYLGTLKPSKNIEGLVEAYQVLREKYGVKDKQLVIAGKKGWLYEEIFRRVKRLGLTKEVVFPGFIPDKEVPSLIKGAALFVLPSFWEGFGIPILEAMAAGVPVVCSRAGSLPEISGGAAVLVTPENTEGIARAMKKVLFDNRLRRRLIKKGKERAAQFSWQKCGQEILNILLEEGKR